MMTHKITFPVDYNFWLNRLDNQLKQSTNQHSIVPKVFKLSKNNMSPPSMIINLILIRHDNLTA